MANRKIKESFAKTKFSTTLKNICGDKVIATADTIADLDYKATLADGTVTEGAYQSEVNKLHADAIEELKNSKANVAFNPNDIKYNDIMKAFEFADCLQDTDSYNKVIVRGILDDAKQETDIIDCSIFTHSNCVYIVNRNMELNQDLELPLNSILCFEGAGSILSFNSNWITGVPIKYNWGSIVATLYTNGFLIQNNTGHPIFDGVCVDIPMNVRYLYSWFLQKMDFGSNISKIMQKPRKYNYIGVTLVLDVPDLVVPYVYLDAIPYRSDELSFNMSLLCITAELSTTIQQVNGEIQTNNDTPIVLILKNIQFHDYVEASFDIRMLFLFDAGYIGHANVSDLICHNNTIIQSSFNPSTETKQTRVQGYYCYIISTGNIIVQSVVIGYIEAPTILSMDDFQVVNVKFEGNFIPRAGTYNNCYFKTFNYGITNLTNLDVLYPKCTFHNCYCTITNSEEEFSRLKKIDSTDNFKIIE